MVGLQSAVHWVPMQALKLMLPQVLLAVLLLVSK
jgi:hypothetical protein